MSYDLTNMLYDTPCALANSHRIEFYCTTTIPRLPVSPSEQNFLPQTTPLILPTHPKSLNIWAQTSIKSTSSSHCDLSCRRRVPRNYSGRAEKDNILFVFFALPGCSLAFLQFLR
jgi:hypothetical protein